MQYLKDGLRQVEICERLNLTKSTVCKLAAKYNSTGSVEAGKSSGRPRVTSKREDNRFRRCAVINPLSSSEVIKIETATVASTRTIRRRLFDTGLLARRPAKKPLLNQQQRLKRIKFCKKYINWTSEDWSRVLFSDEATFQQFQSANGYV